MGAAGGTQLLGEAGCYTAVTSAVFHHNLIIVILFDVRVSSIIVEGDRTRFEQCNESMTEKRAV